MHTVEFAHLVISHRDSFWSSWSIFFIVSNYSFRFGCFSILFLLNASHFCFIQIIHFSSVVWLASLPWPSIFFASIILFNVFHYLFFFSFFVLLLCISCVIIFYHLFIQCCFYLCICFFFFCSLCGGNILVNSGFVAIAGGASLIKL